jgi:guanosine-3',5'-bis(diphosphate) 3'-pyrophosphohydrolase
MDYASSILGFLPGGRRSTGISQLLDKLEAYLSPAQVERVREAYEFGAEKHQGQKRVSGEPYITHPVAVADILADLRLDADTLVAAILHDVIEDTPTAKAEIASIFGQVSPNSSTASASSIRSSSRTARKRRPRASARCCWRWCATSA